jgi:hypothetical protein
MPSIRSTGRLGRTHRHALEARSLQDTSEFAILIVSLGNGTVGFSPSTRKENPMLHQTLEELLDLQVTQTGRRRAPLAMTLTLCCCFSCCCSR